MPGKRINTLLRKGCLSSIGERALWLGRLNTCLQRQLPLSINTVVKLANIDTHRRAVIHVRGGEWATHVRLQQELVKAILRGCGVAEIKGVVVRNRPLKDPVEEKVKPGRIHRPMSRSSRQLIEAAAGSVSDELLRQSLRRLARKRV